MKTKQKKSVFVKFENWTTDNVITHACDIILEKQLNGRFRGGVAEAIQMAFMWQQEQTCKK